MDFKLLLNLFIPFTTEIIVAGLLVTKKKTNFRFHPVLSIAGGLIIAYLFSFISIIWLYNFIKPEQWTEFINIIAYTIPSIGVYLAFFFTYKISASSLLLNLSIAYTFQSIAYQTVCLITDTGLQVEIYKNLGAEWYQSYWPILSNIINYGTYILVYVGLYFVLARTYMKHSKYILKTRYVLTVGVLMYFITNVSNAYIVHHIWWDSKLRLIMCLLLISFNILFDSYVVGSFKIFEHRQENMIIKATLNSKIRQKEMTETNINFINMKCHDLRKELRRLQSKKECLKDEDFALLIDSLNFFDSSVKTGNVNIDALIQDKLIYCNSRGIEFTSLVDGDAFKDIAPSDVFFLFSNIIDNAIEATENVDDSKNRVITLTASSKQGVLYIEQSNYFKGELKFNEDGSIKTTKKNEKYHGYGTKSIAYIVKKYDGQLDIEVKDNIFKLSIVI